jgi:vacuolar-type H+-ATPase subunit H
MLRFRANAKAIDGRTSLCPEAPKLERLIIRPTFSRPTMGRVETLQQVKEAEAKVQEMKREAEAERDKILKDARRTELNLQDQLRKEGEEGYNKVVAEAKQAAAIEREAILDQGRREAKGVKAEGTKNFEKAVAKLVERFEGAVNAKT